MSHYVPELALITFVAAIVNGALGYGFSSTTVPLSQRINAETFRRICMSFDAWVVGFGISTLLRALRIVPGIEAFGVLAAVILADLLLLYRFFSTPRAPGPALSDPLLDKGSTCT